MTTSAISVLNEVYFAVFNTAASFATAALFPADFTSWLWVIYKKKNRTKQRHSDQTTP